MLTIFSAVAHPIGEWQDTDTYSGSGRFFDMCDAIQGIHPSSKNTTHTHTDVDPDTALKNYASWFKENYLFYCKLRPKTALACTEPLRVW